MAAATDVSAWVTDPSRPAAARAAPGGHRLLPRIRDDAAGTPIARSAPLHALALRFKPAGRAVVLSLDGTFRSQRAAVGVKRGQAEAPDPGGSRRRKGWWKRARPQRSDLATSSSRS
jgi:hypothetical protein